MRKSIFFFLFIFILLCMFGFPSFLHAQSYTLRISRIAMLKTPQSGTWKAGVTLYLDYWTPRAEKSPTAAAIWHGGETEFEGASAVLPVNLKVAYTPGPHKIMLFIGLDDKAENAGSPASASDKLFFDFIVSAITGKENFAVYQTKDWNVVAYYTLQQNTTMKPLIHH